MNTPGPNRPLAAQGWIALTLVLLLAQGASARQQALPPGFGQRVQPAAPAKPEPQAQPAAAAAAQSPSAPQLPPAATFGGLSLQNVSLAEVIDALARQLKINYILDAKVQGGVTLNTYGEVRDINPRELLDTILRINGAAMVQTGSVYRIVPLAELANMPLQPQLDEKSIPEDDRAMLNLVFLKYADAEELSKLIKEFLGPEGRIWSYTPANLLLVLDGRRSMKRTMELVSLFDSDVLAKQRVRLFDVANGRPSELANELEGLLKSISMGKDLQSIRFVPVDRINVLIAVAPNPGVFAQVEEWIKKLDVRVDNPSGKTDTYVYRVKYGRAEMLSMSIMALFSQMWGYGGYGGMMGGMGYGGMMGGTMGGYGMNPMGMGGYGMNPMAMGGYGMNPMGGIGMTGGAAGLGARSGTSGAGGAAGQTGAAGQLGVNPMGANMTGQFLGAGGMMGGMGMPMMGPRVVPNMMDNSLLILATGEEYASISKLLRQLDVPPRQVLIETKIYEVTLSGALSYGVSAYLRDKADTAAGGQRKLLGQMTNTGVNLTFGALIGQSRALFAALSTGEVRDRTRIVSAPSIIATDSVAASINVGVEVPVLQSQAVTGVQTGGSSLFANTISNRKTGVTLQITPRVNPSGVVTLEVNQEVSAPQAPGTGAIQSPSFSQRTISTQVTVEDGDMIAIGGIISETRGDSSSGIPLLHRLPVVGGAFGGKSSNVARTELVIFITPRVIYDTNEVAEASDELKSKMRRLQRVMQE